MQLTLECRRKGLGRFLLQILEVMAFKANLSKVILTVFKHNPVAVSFFKNLGYVSTNIPISILFYGIYVYIFLFKVHH